MNFRAAYRWVDIHGQASKQWARVKLADVNKRLIEPSKSFKCFQSVQRYESDAKDQNEPFWQPLFFDFDAAGDPGSCIKDVKALLCFLSDILHIHKQFSRVYFSGSKGFHVIVEPEVLGVVPAKNLHLTVKQAAMYIAEMLHLETFDPKVYSVRRVLRIPGTIHEKTRLWKIELDPSELALGMPAILKMAEAPRKPLWPDPDQEQAPDAIDVVDEAKEFWDGFVLKTEAVQELVNLKPDKKIVDFGDLPVCMKHLLGLTSLPEAHTGNRTLLSMATYLKDAGRTVEQAIDTLVPWFVKLNNVGGAGDVAMLTASSTATIKYVYHRGDSAKEGYTFSCKYILALSHGDHKIPCQGLQCPAIKHKMQQTKDVIPLPLADFSKAVYLGERVKVPTLISGKAGTPYVVPKRIRLTCTPGEDGKFCAGCPAAQFNGDVTFEYGPTDPEILEIVNCSNKDQWAAMKRKWRVPKCMSNILRVEESMNIEEVRMSPAATDITDFAKSEFVNRKGYFIGYPIESNKRYECEGYPAKEPKTQTSAFIFAEKKKLETDVEAFKMTEEIRNELKIFQPEGQSTAEEKWTAIHHDLAHNVYRIWDRMELAWAIDLVAHSVRGFRFRNEPFVKGWAELLIVGDSGQGKTTIVKRLVQSHYRVGDVIDGGSARRTGLLYSYQDNGKTWMLQWGACVLNDLGMVTIDEFGDLPEDQFAAMTSVRSSGIVRATGVITAETFARFRFIGITNCKKGMHLAEYEFPVTAIKQIVPAAEDIRRFDFACSVASGEVGTEVINRATTDAVPHQYTAPICANLVRWAWSRKEDQVVFEESASLAILNAANQMSTDFFAGEIPLVEPADQRHKIARLSVACAARLFSSDETWEKIIVKEEHVKFVIDLLYRLYLSPHFRYLEWSQEQRKTDVGNESEMGETVKELQKHDGWKTILGVLLMPGQINQHDVDALMNNRAKAQAALNVMRMLGLVESKFGKYYKTARGLRLPNFAIDAKIITKDEIDRVMTGQAPQNFFSSQQRTF